MGANPMKRGENNRDFRATYTYLHGEDDTVNVEPIVVLFASMVGSTKSLCEMHPLKKSLSQVETQ